MDRKLISLIEKELCDAEMKTEEIPAIDLYMDQIITLIEEKYDANRRTPDEKILTKTMINNYSKEGLIKPIKGKKYTKEQIMQMLAIYAMKNTLSIQEIKTALQGADVASEFDLVEAWEMALSQKQKQRAVLAELMEELCITPDCETSKTDQLASLLAVTSLSCYCQRIAQQMVELYFKSELE
ncbi:MAG: DUF1836 domain-containing protein [Faecalibacterium sp.]